MVNPKKKGSRFERTVAGLFRSEGYEAARRSQQYAGINNDADVVGVPGIHIECKAVERLNIYDAMSQAKRDKREDEFPVVIHKKNHHNVLVTMEFTDWIQLYREWEAGMELKKDMKENEEDT